MYITTAITDGNVLSITCPNLYCQRQGVIEQAEVSASSCFYMYTFVKHYIVFHDYVLVVKVDTFQKLSFVFCEGVN